MLTAIRQLIQRTKEANDPAVQQRKRLKRAMEQASSFEEWSVAASKLDQVEGMSPEEKKARWKRDTKLYDRRLVEERLRHLRAVRKGGKTADMMFAVRSDLLRNLGNMANRYVFVFIKEISQDREAPRRFISRLLSLALPISWAALLILSPVACSS